MDVGSGSATAGKPRVRGALALASLEGRVTRAADGAGIPGATVSLAPAELMAMFVSNDAPTLVAVTDASGGWKAPNVRPGAYVVAATATGFLPSTRAKLTVGAAEQRRGVDLVLAAGGTIVRGTVSDVGGGPIPDARITATPQKMPELSGRANLVVTTNAEGQYELTLADGEFNLRATHDDYTGDSEPVELAGRPVTVDFTLVPGAVIRGHIVARDSGKPVVGGLVRAESGRRGRGGSGSTFADDDGKFVLRGLDAGAIEISAFGRGYASVSPTVVSVGVGEQLEGVTVVVDRAYSISGRTVRKSAPSEGLSGITLGAFSIAAKSFGLALEPSAEDGAFEIVGLRPASYIVGAVGEGSVPEIGKTVDVVDKDVEGVLIELAAGVTIAGRVEPPLARVNISIAPQGAIGIANMFEAAKAMLVHGETDATGAFVLNHVPAGAFTLNAAAPAGDAGELPLLVGDAPQAGLVVRLEARASVSGRVIDTSGSPVAAASVDASRLDDDKPVKISFSGGAGRDATTRPDGTFTIKGLDPGKYSVRASVGSEDRLEAMLSKGKASKAAVELELVAATPRTGVTLTVEARDGTLRGTVIAPDNRPAADAWVRARRVVDRPEGLPAGAMRYLDATGPPVLTNADGQFTIGKLRKGTYNVSVEGPRGATHGEKLGVKTGDSVTIQLVSLGTLTGKVTLAGSPVLAYDIACDGKGQELERHVTDKDGAYSLERLRPGRFDCTASGDAGTAKGTVEVPAGAATLDLALTRWATVTGIVVSVLDGKPIAGVNVFAGGEAFSPANFGSVLAGKAPVTDPAGRFAVERVGVGQGKVFVMPRDGFTPLGTRDYTAGEGQRVDVGTIEIVPPRSGDAGTFGLATAIEGDQLVVTTVKEGGPAASAGVQVGDRIKSINDREIATLTLPIASLLLASGNVGVGQQARLVLDRTGTQVAVTLISVKW